MTDNPEGVADEELVSLTLKNSDNYRHLIRRYERPLARYVLRIAALPREDVEDILQVVFIKAYQNLEDFDPALKFSSWVYRITHNETVSHLRRLSSRPQITLGGEDENEAERFVANLNLEEILDQHFLAGDTWKVLEAMDPKYREVLVLKFLEEKDYREIADILKKPIGTVGTLILRAKAQFKKTAQQKKVSF